jgi:glycerol kinase
LNSRPYILALDLGTQSVRAVVVNRAGTPLTHAQQPFTLQRRSATEIEQDGPAIIAATLQVIAAALQQFPGVAQAGLASQRSSVIAWDRQTGAALSPVLSWQDTRAADFVKTLAPQQSFVQSHSGLVLSPHYGASKLRWLLHNNGAVQHALAKQRLCLGPLAAYVLFHILKNRPYLVDESNAARMQLWNIRERCWDPELCRLFEIERRLLPDCVPTLHHYGVINNTDIALKLVCGDQNAAFYGYAGQSDADTAQINLGTGAFILSPAATNVSWDVQTQAGLLTSVGHSDNNSLSYLLEATVNGAGAALQWFAAEYAVDNLHAQLPRWLDNIDSPPVFLNTIGGLGSPWWRTDIASRFIGIHDAKTEPAGAAVAIIESIVFMLAYNLQRMTQIRQRPFNRCIIGGGLAQLDGLCRKLADLTGRPLLRPASTETTTAGIIHLLKPNDSGNQNGDRTAAHAASGETHFKSQPNPSLHARYRIFTDAIAAATAG